MKTSRIIVFLFCAGLLVLVSGVVSAQPPGGMPDPEAMAANRANQLRKDLKKAELPLSKDQETRVFDLYQEGAVKIQAVIQANMGDREAIRSKIQPIREEQEKKLKEILTATQWEYYDKNLKGKGRPQGMN